MFLNRVRGRTARQVAICSAVLALGLAAVGALDFALAQGSPFGVGAPKSAPPPQAGTGIVGWIIAKQNEFYLGLRTAIRAVSQDREAIALMGARPQRLYLVTSAVGGAMAGVAGALLIIQYAVHPYFGAAFGPLTFMICVLGGLGNMVGAFFAAFIMAQVISVGGVMVSTEMGYVIAFVIFIVLMFVRPGGIFAKRA